MGNLVEETAARLADTNAGWVTRRDSAELLGRIAGRALEALRAHADDSDRDVRAGVKRALGGVSGALHGIEPVAQERPFSLKELAESVAKPGSREVKPKGDGYEIVVALNDGRRQLITVEPTESRSGRPAIRLSTPCGPAREGTLKWALEQNLHFAQAALAIDESGDGDELAMVNTFLADAVTPAEFKACIKEMAFYADWLEEQLTKSDVF